MWGRPSDYRPTARAIHRTHLMSSPAPVIHHATTHNSSRSHSRHRHRSHSHSRPPPSPIPFQPSMTRPPPSPIPIQPSMTYPVISYPQAPRGRSLSHSRASPVPIPNTPSTTYPVGYPHSAPQQIVIHHSHHHKKKSHGHHHSASQPQQQLAVQQPYHHQQAVSSTHRRPRRVSFGRARTSSQPPPFRPYSSIPPVTDARFRYSRCTGRRKALCVSRIHVLPLILLMFDLRLESITEANRTNYADASMMRNTFGIFLSVSSVYIIYFAAFLIDIRERKL